MLKELDTYVNASVEKRKATLTRCKLTDKIKEDFELFRKRVLELESIEHVKQGYAYTFTQEGNKVTLTFSTQNPDCVEVNNEYIKSDAIYGRWIVNPVKYDKDIDGSYCRIYLEFESEKKLPLLIWDFDCDPYSYTLMVIGIDTANAGCESNLIHYLNFKHSDNGNVTLQALCNSAAYCLDFNKPECIYYSYQVYLSIKNITFLLDAIFFMENLESDKINIFDLRIAELVFRFMYECERNGIYLIKLAKFISKGAHSSELRFKKAKEILEQLKKSVEIDKVSQEIEKSYKLIEIEKAIKEIDESKKDGVTDTIKSFIGKAVDVSVSAALLLSMSYVFYKMQS